ncbi:S8 family serine peptidase [Algoriphagus formosus]|uniref:T9SS type A sorting domain-containing protein n=1 Tax=Algoriphagus formosus TaxID=2007308 RepID=A0A4R5V892_9BACT|nr:S8 family serine peptidase [Algoriphagus aquimaris]TDK48184.1 T9SS type A sorting domain-containing protein [Algoriphagus aquimaris]
MNRLLICVVTLWLLPFLVEAQDRYAVFYKYKPQDGLNLDQPQDFLTDRALLRRAKEGVAVDSTDLPVTQRYVDEVYQLSHYILYQSKWLNASLIVTDMEGAKSIAELPFVEKVELVGKGYIPNPNARIGRRLFVSATAKVCPPGGKAERTLAAQELPSDFQNSLLGIDFMHEEGFKGKGIRIAVFDAGFPGTDNASPLSHLLSNNQLVAKKDFVRPWNQNVFTDNQHGTNVLSLIAAVETESFIAGAPEAEYFLAMTEEVATEYRIEEYNWLRAAEYADSIGVDIINSSLGYYDFDDPEMNYSSGQLDGKTAVITQAANIASSKGILVVNSVGNYGPSEPSILAPADSPNVLAIGSVNQSLEVSNFSSRGPTGDGRIKPDLAAFGNGVALLRSNGNVGFANGTSFSAPQITALAAGLWQAKPEWTRAELIENLLRSASQYENPDNLLGYGIPNFREALYGEILSVEENGEIIPWKVFPNPMEGNKLTIYFGSSLSAEFSLIDLNGKTLQNQSLSRNTAKDPYELQLEGIRPGMYIIQMQDGKLIKQQKLIRL